MRAREEDRGKLPSFLSKGAVNENMINSFQFPTNLARRGHLHSTSDQELRDGEGTV